MGIVSRTYWGEAVGVAGNSDLLRRDPDFRRYWIARMISLGGSMVTYVALPVLVYRVTGSNLWTGLVAVAEGLPYLCFGLIAGAFADRADRQRVMVVADLGSAAVLASLPVAYAMGRLTAPHILLAALAAQTLFVFFDTANAGALPAVAGRDRLPVANSALTGGGTVIEVTVPGLVGALLVVVAPAPLIILDVLSFVASALLIRQIVGNLRATAPAERRHLVAEIGDGLRFLFGHRLVRMLTVIGALTSVSVAAFMSQLVPWMDQVLGIRPSGDWRFAAMWVVMSLGGLAGSVMFPAVARRLDASRVALLFVPASAVCAAACALFTLWWAAALAGGIWYVAYMITALSTLTLRQQVTPDRLQSRVNATARMLVFGLGWPAGALLGGVLSQAYGPSVALWAAAATLAVTAILAWGGSLRTVRPGELVPVRD
ncbi:MAG TPA: MFS transporter [Micromonosporaceae bacterium]|nr:MFS transporter [Micromonosporaceae bacterium]